MRKDKGAFLVLDGTDGSGKQTQATMLVDRLRTMDVDVRHFTFPQYETPIGGAIRALLDGKHGDFTAVSSRAASLLFAADRLEAAQSLRRLLKEGAVVVCDRYVTANLAHQGSKIPAHLIKEREEFVDWILKLEYEHLALPRPTVSLILKVPVEISLTLLKERSRVSGTPLDTHESSESHLRAAYDMFSLISTKLPDIKTVHCAPEGFLLNRVQIHELVWEKVFPHLFAQVYPPPSK